jgi:hypothetical protein
MLIIALSGWGYIFLRWKGGRESVPSVGGVTAIVEKRAATAVAFLVAGTYAFYKKRDLNV